MNKRNRLEWIPVLALLLLAMAGCTTDGSVDDADGAPVQLEIQIQDNPPVEAQEDPNFGCLFEVREWTATAFNIPKNAEAGTEPFNDIVLQDVSILYTWDPPDPAGWAPPIPRVVPLTGTVPVGASIAFSYTPIFLDDVSSALEGRTAALSMTFRARTVAGESITLTTGDTLSVNACSSPPPDPVP